MKGSDNLGEFLESYYNAFMLEHRYMAYLDGLKNTLLISLFAILIGTGIGIIVAMTKVSLKKTKGKNSFTRFFITLISGICNGYINIIRGTPVMVQLLIIYNLIFTARDTSEIMVGAICFGINSGAYVAEIVRAGIESIDNGQNEAGRSLGLNNIQTMIYIILPQAIRNILPALGNEFISLIKETSVAGVIAVTDLTKAAQYIGSRTYDPLPPLIITAIFYLIIVLGLTKLLRMLERRMSQGDKN